jgi:hypothetical protein
MPLRRTLPCTLAALLTIASPGLAVPPEVTTAHTGLNGVTKLCFDSQGNLYAALRAPSNSVVKIPAGGGAPVTFATGFADPLGIVCDSQGNLFVTNGGAAGNRVDKVTPGGTRTVFATGFTTPSPIAIDPQDNLYVGDYFSQVVRKITPAGVVSSYGSAGLGIGSNGENRRLTALLYDPPTGRLLCGTFGPGDGTGPFPIRSLPPGGGTSSPVCVSSFAVTDIVLGPAGIYYFAGYQNDVISRSVLPAVPTLYAGGTNLNGFVDGPLMDARFSIPAGLALDRDGLIYVADTVNDAIRVLNDPYDGPTPVERGTWGRLKDLYRR